MPSAAQQHQTAYFDYDRKVDLVSVAEVWFDKSETMKPTVKHFERFPRYTHHDGDEVTPEFTVLFQDQTALIGEISSLGLSQESLDSLARQAGRYETLREVPSAPLPGGGHALEEVEAVDVVVFMPHSVANHGAVRLDEAARDADHAYSPAVRPMVLGWSFDQPSQSYTFTRDPRAGNDLLRDHGRDPSLSKWLEQTNDTLRGLPQHFIENKLRGRFMNDSPPPLYTAVVVWGDTLPRLLAARGDRAPATIDTTAAELADLLRADYGYGLARDVERALEFLAVARLAERTASGWRIYFSDLSRTHTDITQALLVKFASAPKRRARPGGAEPEDDEEHEPPFEPLTLW